MYGVSQETVSIEDIEKYSLTKETQAKQLYDIKQFRGVEEIVLLSTEQRNEYYLHVDETQFKHGDLLRYLSEFTNKSLKEVILETYSKFNEDAIRHLFSVASGMETRPTGKIQPLAATEEATALAHKEKTIGFVLKDLFQQAIQYAHKVHLLPVLAPLNQAEAAKCIRLVQTQCESIKDKQFVLFGEDEEMIHLARLLLTLNAESITVANANYESSETVCSMIQSWEVEEESEPLRRIYPTQLKDVCYRLASADAMIVSSSVQHAWLSKELLDEMKELRQTKKAQVVVDLGEAQEEYLLSHESDLNYIKLSDKEQDEFTEEEKEEAVTYLDESLLHATDHFMERYNQFTEKKETHTFFTKMVPETGY